MRNVGLAREIDVVLALIGVGWKAIGRTRADDPRRQIGPALRQIGAQRQRAEEVVAVLVVVTGNRDEIIAAQRLIDLRVVLLLADLPVVVERVVVLGAAGGKPRAQAGGVDVTGFDLGE